MMPMLRLTNLFTFIAAAACSALLPAAFAVDPPPDGGYPNGNTAEGTNALFYSGPEPTTQPWVTLRSRTIRSATTTRRPAPMR